MSRSPRKLLQRAADAVREFDEVLERYPDAEASVRSALGEEGLAEVRQARDALARAAERLAVPQEEAPVRGHPCGAAGEPNHASDRTPGPPSAP